MSNPRMVKEEDQVMPRSGQIFSLGSSRAPTRITWGFSRLHARPDIDWKLWMYLVAALRFSGVLFKNKMVSSANVSALASVRA